MARERKELKRKIASLSALGAGALIAGTGIADASTIYAPIDVVLGPGSHTQLGLPLVPGGTSTALSFAFGHTLHVGSITHINHSFIRGFGQKALAVQFASTGGSGHLLRLFSSSSVFSNAAAGSNVFVGSRSWGTVDGGNRSAVAGQIPFSPTYALFRFTPTPGQTDYGWILLSYSVTKGFGNNPALGPDLTLYSYAWDNTGKQLAAGAGVPEPDTMALTGLGALVLGAVGLRRWRKNRQTA
jgi:hypothetical protein